MGKLFGSGSAATADAGAYPSKDELLPALDAACAAGLAALAGLSPEALTTPMPDEDMRDYFPTVGDAMVYMMLVHESIHMGQLTSWRRAMGMPLHI